MHANEILDTLRTEFKLTSDYQVAKKLEISRSRVSNYRNNKATMNDELIIAIEKLLDLPEGSMLLEMQAERTNCPEAARIFHKISDNILSKVAVVILCIGGVSTYSNNAIASGDFVTVKIDNNIHYAELKCPRY